MKDPTIYPRTSNLVSRPWVLISTLAARFWQTGDASALFARVLREQVVDILLADVGAPLVRHRLHDVAGVGVFAAVVLISVAHEHNHSPIPPAP